MEAVASEARARLAAAYDISDTVGERKLTLRRELDGAQVTVVVDAATPEWLDGADDDGAEAGADDDDDNEKGEDVYFLTVSLTRGSQQLLFDCYAGHNAGLAIRHVHHAAANATDDELREGDLYTGPEFEDLDLEVQEAFYNALGDIGVDDDFADGVAWLAEAKDQSEYVRWLENVKEFME